MQCCAAHCFRWYLQPPLHDVSSLINSDPHVDPVTIALGSDTKNEVADGKMSFVGKGKGASMDSEDNLNSEETRKVSNTFECAQLPAEAQA